MDSLQAVLKFAEPHPGVFSAACEVCIDFPFDFLQLISYFILGIAHALWLRAHHIRDQPGRFPVPLTAHLHHKFHVLLVFGRVVPEHRHHPSNGELGKRRFGLGLLNYLFASLPLLFLLSPVQF